MTFTPTPKAELEPFDALVEHQAVLTHEIMSRLYHAEQAADWAATQIAALYAALPNVADLTLTWKGSNATANPGLAGLAIANTSGQNRAFAVGVGDGSFDDAGPGSTLVLTDAPDTPPITAFRQYVITSTVLDHGAWVSFTATRIATFGTLTTPPVGSEVRLILR